MSKHAPTRITMLRTYDGNHQAGRSYTVERWLAEKLCGPSADDGGPFAKSDELTPQPPAPIDDTPSEES